PLKRPTGRPCASVGAGVVNRDFVLQRVHVRSRKSLDQMKLVGMRQSAIAEPEFFVKTSGIHDERVAFPSASRVSVIEGIVVVASKLATLRASVCVDEVPIVIAPAGHQKNPSEGWVFYKLIAVRHLKLTQRARRQAKQIHRIIFEKVALAIDEEV